MKQKTFRNLSLFCSFLWMITFIFGVKVAIETPSFFSIFECVINLCMVVVFGWMAYNYSHKSE